MEVPGVVVTELQDDIMTKCLLLEDSLLRRSISGKVPSTGTRTLPMTLLRPSSGHKTYVRTGLEHPIESS